MTDHYTPDSLATAVADRLFACYHATDQDRWQSVAELTAALSVSESRIRRALDRPLNAGTSCARKHWHTYCTDYRDNKNSNFTGGCHRVGLYCLGDAEIAHRIRRLLSQGAPVE